MGWLILIIFIAIIVLSIFDGGYGYGTRPPRPPRHRGFWGPRPPRPPMGRGPWHRGFGMRART